MSTRRSRAVVVGAGIAGCLAALSLRSVLDEVALEGDDAPGARVDFPMTFGPALARELRDLGLGRQWDEWDGKTAVALRLSAWDTPEPAPGFPLVPSEPRFLVRRSALERFLRALAEAHGVATRKRSDGPVPEDAWLVDATGRPARVARSLGARRRALGRLVALHGVAEGSPLPLHAVAVHSASDGWWFAARLDGPTAVMYLRSGRAASGEPGVRVPPAPRGFAELVGPVRFGRPVSLASMSWLESPGAGRWRATGDAALALDPILGSGVEVAVRSARLLRESAGAPDDHPGYAAAMQKLVAEHRIARHRLYGRAAALHGGPFWAEQVRMC